VEERGKAKTYSKSIKQKQDTMVVHLDKMEAPFGGESS